MRIPGFTAEASLGGGNRNRSFPALFLVGLSPGQRTLFPYVDQLGRAGPMLSDEDLALIADLLSLDRPTAGQLLDRGELDLPGDWGRI